MHSQLAAEIIPGEVFTDHQTIRFAPKNPMGVLRQPTVPIILCRSYLEYEETFFLFSPKTQIFSEKYLYFLISHDQATKH